MIELWDERIGYTPSAFADKVVEKMNELITEVNRLTTEGTLDKFVASDDQSDDRQAAYEKGWREGRLEGFNEGIDAASMEFCTLVRGSCCDMIQKKVKALKK